MCLESCIWLAWFGVKILEEMPVFVKVINNNNKKNVIFEKLNVYLENSKEIMVHEIQLSTEIWGTGHGLVTLWKTWIILEFL